VHLCPHHNRTGIGEELGRAISERLQQLLGTDNPPLRPGRPAARPNLVAQHFSSRTDGITWRQSAFPQIGPAAEMHYRQRGGPRPALLLDSVPRPPLHPHWTSSSPSVHLPTTVRGVVCPRDRKTAPSVDCTEARRGTVE